MLQSRGTGVFLVSGGFRAIINPIADILRIPQDHVYANTILFRARFLLLACMSSLQPQTYGMQACMGRLVDPF